ncbi:RNA-directed DNA polymerase, eukaryota, partial [Tanacetum coccineum]
ALDTTTLKEWIGSGVVWRYARRRFRGCIIRSLIIRIGMLGYLSTWLGSVPVQGAYNPPGSGVEQDQLTDLTTYVEGVVLGVTWYWTLDGSGEFSVASARKVIDDNRFPEVSTQTRWIKAVPIKVNIHAWKVRIDCLPTRLNISRRGIDIPSILCPVCGSVTESSSHLFFDCLVAKDNFRKICRWWEVDFMEVHTFDEWVSWIVNLRIPIKHKRLLEGVCFGLWWLI